MKPRVKLIYTQCVYHTFIQIMYSINQYFKKPAKRWLNDDNESFFLFQLLNQPQVELLIYQTTQFTHRLSDDVCTVLFQIYLKARLDSLSLAIQMTVRAPSIEKAVNKTSFLCKHWIFNGTPNLSGQNPGISPWNKKTMKQRSEEERLWIPFVAPDRIWHLADGIRKERPWGMKRRSKKKGFLLARDGITEKARFKERKVVGRVGS